MGSIWRRFLSMTLALAMVVCMAPVQALAAQIEAADMAAEFSEQQMELEATAAEPESTQETVKPTEVPIADPTDAPAALETQEPSVEDATVAPTEVPEKETDAAVEAAQEKIDALPTMVYSEKEADELSKALADVRDAIAALTTEQADRLNLGNYNAAVAALEAWYAQSYDDEELADLENCYWDGNTLYIKDGKKIDLYAALLEKTEVANPNGVKYGTEEISKWTYGLVGTQVKSGSSVFLDQGTYYYAVQIKKSTLSYSYVTGSFQVAYYHDLSAVVAADAPAGAAITLSKNRVKDGDSVKITVAEVEGYTATVTDSKGNVVADLNSYVPTESTTLKATYISNAAAKYKVTLETIGTEYGAAELKSEVELVAGAEALVSAVANESTEFAYYYIESVKVGDQELTVNGNGDYVYTMGEADVTITVTFGGSVLSAKETEGSVQVKFNGYADATVDQQLESKSYYADVENKKHLEQVIVEALDVKLNDTELEAADVEIQYDPWYQGVFSKNWTQEENYTALNGTPAEEVLKTAYTFGTSGKNETVVITYTLENGTVLTIVREVSLTEGRKALPDGAIKATSDTVSAEAIKAAAAKAVTFANIPADDFVLEENWESKLVVGEAVGVSATADFAGNGEYVGGTVKVTVAVTKVSEPAEITVNTEGTGSGTHDIPASAYAGTVNFTITPEADGSYVDAVTLGDQTVELSYDATVASGSFEVENDTDYTVTIHYAKATMVAKEDAELALNLYVDNYVDYSARLDGLKGKLLKAVLGEVENEDDYDVFVYTTTLGLSGSYKDLNTVKSIYPHQIEGDIKIKITKKATDDGKIPAVTVEGIIVSVVESREEPTIELKATSFEADDLKDLAKKIAAQAMVTDVDGADVTANAGVEAVLNSEEALTADEQSYSVTIKATKDGLTWLKGEESFTVQAKLSQYDITWDAGDGCFKVDDAQVKTMTTTQYYGETVVAPEAKPEKAQTEAHTYTFDGWKGLMESTTVSGEMSFTAEYAEADRIYTISWNAGEGAFADGKNSKTTEVAYGQTPVVPEEPEAEEKSFSGWKPEIAAVTGEATYTAQYTDDVVYKVTFAYENGEDALVLRINATKGDLLEKPEAPVWMGHVFTGWQCNVEGVEFGETPSCTKKDITFTAQWADDENENGVDDAEETLSVHIEGEGTVQIGKTALLDGESYVYDSLSEDVLTLTATPVVEDGYSVSYVVSIAGEGVGEATYTKYAAAASFMPVNGMEISVTFADAAFQLNEERVLDYYPGMSGVQNKDVYSAAVVSPEWNDDAEITVEYLARKGGETVYINIDELEIDAIFKSALKLVYSSGKIPVEQSETWVTLDADLSEYDFANVDSYTDLINDLLQERLKNIDWKNLTKEIKSIISDIESSAKYYDAHEFGYNASATQDTKETIRLSYSNEARKIKTETDITLHDYRTPTQIVGSDMTLVYKDFLDSDLVSMVTVQTVDGATVSGASVTLAKDSEGMQDNSVSDVAYSVNFCYAGDETYKPSEATLQLTITKAGASMSIGNVITTYGSGYGMSHNVSHDNAYGDAQEIEDSLIKFVAGLDVSNASVGESGVSGVNTVIQLMLPENLKNGLTDIIGGVFEDGVEMSLSSLVEYLSLIDSDSLGVLKQALEAISQIAGAGDVTIKLGGKLPSNVGTYLYGAVSTTGNYETVLDVAYIIIKPNAQRVYLNWNYNDTNGIFTDTLLQLTDLGASAYDDESFVTCNEAATGKIRNLFFGVNKGKDNKPALVLKLYGADIDPETFEKQLGNGGFTQMAFIADFGNSLHYAVPIVRAFAIVPNTLKVSIADEEGTNFRRIYDGEKQELTITVNGEQVESGLEVCYTGINTRGEVYNSDSAPVDAGAYVVTAVYRKHDDSDKLTDIGMAVKNLLVLPAETETTVDDAIVTVGETVKLSDLIHVSWNSGAGKPDMTILTAQLATDGSFSEIGMDAIHGNVNVDFPSWVDEILEAKAPEIYQGVTVAELSEILNGKLKNMLDNIQLGDELTDGLKEILDGLNDSLKQMPENATVTFEDTSATAFEQVGVYLVAAVVTDSNYTVSADHGLVVVKPDVEKVYLDWNYHDNNGIWTEELLRNVDLYASAYSDVECLHKDEEATKSITYSFLTIDADGELQVYHNADELSHGAYMELAYIELEVDGRMTMSNLIARPIVTVPNAAKVEFVDENNAVNHDRKFIYDGEAHGMKVRITLNGSVVEPQEGELTVTYRGVTTAGERYTSSEAPTEAGIYTVTAVFARYEGEKLITGGAAAGAMVIEPAEVEFYVTGGIVAWDGEKHGVTVEPEDVDCTLISATAAVGGELTEIGFEAVSGNLNVDFPKWVDEIFEEKHPNAYKNGIDAKTLIEKLEATTDSLTAMGIDESWIDRMVELLKKVPANMNVTFEDDIAFTDPGVYVFAGFLTDFNYVPAFDTALLMIQKEDSGLAFEDTEVYYDGEAHGVTVVNADVTDYATVIIDRENNIANILFEDDLTALKALLEKALGCELPDEIDLTALMNAVNTAIGCVESFDKLPTDVAEALTQLKEVLKKLPQSGTIYIDGDWRPVDAGEYEFYGISLSPHYQTKTLAAKLAILPAEIEITVEDREIYYGEDEPVNRAEVTVKKGVVELEVTVSREKGNDVGEYAYKVDYTESDNYKVVEKLGKLTILPAEIEITVEDREIYYGEDEPVNRAIIDVKKGAVALEVTVSREKGYDAGEYAYKVDYTKSNNYNVVEKLGKLTILPAEIEITVEDREIYYGEDEPVNRAIVDVKKGAVALEVTVSREKGNDAGEYAYKVDYTKSDNYKVVEKLGKLTILPVQVSITVLDAKKTEGEEDPVNEPIVNIVPDTMDKSLLNILVTRAEGETVGDYPYQISYTKSKNYEVTLNAGMLTIQPKQDDREGLYPIYFQPADQEDTIQPNASVEIDGKKYTLDENCIAWVDHKDAKIAQTYAYHKDEDAHHSYPVHMYVWYLTFTDGEEAKYDAELIPELTDFFQYHGTSIRVNFTSNGIRFMTSVNAKDADALIQGNLIQNEAMAGYRMTKAGTLFKWGTTADALTNNGSTASSLVYGVSGESSFRVFQKVGNRNWFTGMLTNLGTDKATLNTEMISRPYAVLERDGESITIYGGTIQRSIYYVAKQNEDWKVGTVYNDYIKDIIAAVEGE